MKLPFNRRCGKTISPIINRRLDIPNLLLNTMIFINKYLNLLTQQFNINRPLFFPIKQPPYLSKRDLLRNKLEYLERMLQPPRMNNIQPVPSIPVYNLILLRSCRLGLINWI